MMMRSNNIFGMSIGGAGLALVLLAGSAVAACPEHDKAAKGDPPTCSLCVAAVEADTCDQPEAKKTKRTIVLRFGSDKLDLGSGSFGDLKFDSDNLVVSGPEKKQHVIVKRLHTSSQPEREVRVEIRIVGPDGEAREFSFKGDDFDFGDFDFGGFDFDDFDFNFDFGLKGLEGLKHFGRLLELKESKHLGQSHEIEGLKDHPGLHEQILKHLNQSGGGHGFFQMGDGKQIVIELGGDDGFPGLSETIHADVLKKLMSGVGDNFFVIDGDDVVKLGDKKLNIRIMDGPEKGRHSVGEWRSDDGTMHVIIERDGDGRHRIERHIRTRSNPHGTRGLHVESGTFGHVVIVGPDGEKHEFSFGGHDGAGDGVGHRDGHGATGGTHKIIKRRSSRENAWFDSEDGNVKIEGKMIFIGPDGEKHEIHFDQGGANDWDGPDGEHGLMGFGTGGNTSRFQSGDDAVFQVTPANASFGRFVFDDDDNDAFFSLDHNITFVPDAHGEIGAFSSSDDNVTFFEADDTISIQIVNGKVSATINGKKVPADRIRHTKNVIEILGEDGEVVATVPMMGSFGRAGGNVLFGGQGEGAPRTIWFTGEDQPEPPRVMLGIQMQPVTEDALDRYNLDEGEGIQIVGVIKGLPAQRAGLRENDIIIEIEGIGRVTQEGLRGLLLSKEPGDVIELEIIRDGEIEEITIKLTPYDAEKLGMFVQETPPTIRILEKGFGGRGFDAENFQEMMEKFKGQMGKFNFDEDEMEIATEAFEEAMEGVKEQAAEGGFLLRWGLPGAGQWRVIHGDEPEQIFTIPVEPRTGGGNVAKELALLKDQLAQVQSQRNELAAELAEIKELLKKLARDRD